jgi:hypothetical protein
MYPHITKYLHKYDIPIKYHIPTQIQYTYTNTIYPYKYNIPTQYKILKVTSRFSVEETGRPMRIPKVDSASNRREYQGYLLGGKGGRCIGLTMLPPSCADCLEILNVSNSWSPNGLSRPVMGLLYSDTKSWRNYFGGTPGDCFHNGHSGTD